MKKLMLLFIVMHLGCSHRQTNQTAKVPTHVRFALTNVPLPFLPVILAQQLGFFQQRGLDVEIDDFAITSQVMQALLANSVDVVAGAFKQNLQLAAQRRPVKAFALLVQQSSRVLVAQTSTNKDLRTLEDLKGAVVGVAGLGSVNHLFLNYLLLRHGLKPTDVRTVAIGVGSSAVAALEHKRVDAAVLVGNETEVALDRVAGLHILLDARGADNCRKVFGADNYPGAALISTESWLKKNPETARRMAEAIQASLRWIKQNSPETILEKIPPKYHMDDREAEVRALRIMIPGFSADGFMSQEGAEAAKRMISASDESVRNSSIDLSVSYTNEFLSR